MKNLILFSTFCLTLMTSNNIIHAQNPADYEQRRQDYISTVLDSLVPNIIAVQAYENLPVEQTYLDTIYMEMLTRSTIDFKIVQLIRVLFLSNGTYDNQILPALEQVPFWITKNDTLRGYWSENHNIMWMSSDWLLQEQYGKDEDIHLKDRLIHYLELKIQYGYYEFFSGTYMPYALSGLLNLVDFAQDSVISDLASQAAQRLLKELLIPVNDQGVFYAVAGRNYFSKYQKPFEQNHHNLVYLLTGLGDKPEYVSHGGSFLATSTLDVNPVINSFTQNIDKTYRVGHSIDSVKLIHQDLTFIDRMMFQWSAGCYFHPMFVEETVSLIVDYNMWGHVDFQPFNLLSLIPPENIPGLAENFSSISKSTVIAGQDIAIFKNKSVVLTSIQDFWKGKLGYQQFPIVATVGNTAVFPVSGLIVEEWKNFNSNNANDHLPYVEQKSNVALVMYRGEEKPPLYGATLGTVSLHWHENDFDEIIEMDNWLLGRQAESYVAVRRHCVDMKKGQHFCDDRSGQTWIVIVGNDEMYGSFNEFEILVENATFNDEWHFDSTQTQWAYHAEIVFDTTQIAYTWLDSVKFTNITEQKINEDQTLTLYPNPANETVNIDLTDFYDRNLTVQVFNNLGQSVYFNQKKIVAQNRLSIDIKNWTDGTYFIVIEDTDAQKRFSAKLIKTK